MTLLSVKVALVAPGIAVERAKAVHDGRGRLAFPGVVDAHMHSGIYSPLDEDAVSESKAAAMGGVTSSLNYFRTGQYYLNKGGPYAKFYPEVLKGPDDEEDFRHPLQLLARSVSFADPVTAQSRHFTSQRHLSIRT